MDNELIEGQKRLQAMIDLLPGDSRKPPIAYYGAETDILDIFITGAGRSGHEYLKYEGSWKKGGGHESAIESIHLRNSDGDRIVGIQIWGITKLLESLKEAKAEENKSK